MQLRALARRSYGCRKAHLGTHTAGVPPTRAERRKLLSRVGILCEDCEVRQALHNNRQRVRIYTNALVDIKSIAGGGYGPFCHLSERPPQRLNRCELHGSVRVNVCLNVRCNSVRSKGLWRAVEFHEYSRVFLLMELAQLDFPGTIRELFSLIFPHHDSACFQRDGCNLRCFVAPRIISHLLSSH